MLHINDLTYRIGDRVLIDHATVALPADAKAGLVGRNGAGKTTLFHLIAGALTPETGAVSLPRNARVGQVAQEAPSGEEPLIDIVLAADTERAALLAEAEHATDAHRIAEVHTRLADIDAHSAEARAAAILAGLGFDAAAKRGPASALSGGWRMRVALAAALFAAPDLLLLDEPTNYLDLEGVVWLESFLARYPHTVLVISHDRDLLNRLDLIVHLDRGKLALYRGGYDSFDRQRREAQALQAKLRKKQADQRRHLQAFVDRFRYKASKARQAQSRVKMLAKLEPIAAITDESIVPFRFPEPARPAAPPLVTMEDVAVGYAPGHPVLSRLTLRIDDDDRIALLGANGNGKSTLAKLIAGRVAPQSGRLHRFDRLSVAYFAQHQIDELDATKSAYDHVRALMPDAAEAVVRSRAGGFGFPLMRMNTPAGDLSGGEKARLLLGLATFAGPNLMILDEPTNHLDIDAREALVVALAEYSGAVILISHDRHLVETSADRLWVVAGGTVQPWEGDMEDYRRAVLDRDGIGGPQSPAAQRNGADTARNGDPNRQKKPSNTGRARRRDAAARRAETAHIRQKIKASEALMNKLRKEIQELDVRLSDSGLYDRDPAAAATLAKARSDAVRALAEAEELWLATSAELELAEAS